MIVCTGYVKNGGKFSVPVLPLTAGTVVGSVPGTGASTAPHRHKWMPKRSRTNWFFFAA